MAEQSSCMRNPFGRTALKIQFRVEVYVCVYTVEDEENGRRYHGLYKHTGGRITDKLRVE